MEYNNHYLTNVIFRVDFVSGIEQIKTNLHPDVKANCIKNFPIAESIEMTKRGKNQFFPRKRRYNCQL